MFHPLDGRPGPMIDHGDAELLPWEMLYNFDGAVNRATARLDEIAASEAVLGYDESAQMYRDAARDLRESRLWFHKEFKEIVEALKSGA